LALACAPATLSLNSQFLRPITNGRIAFYAHLAPDHLAKAANRLDSLAGWLRFGYAGEGKAVGRRR
jgi:hypothetical protein